jgi:hypothetical protein
MAADGIMSPVSTKMPQVAHRRKIRFSGLFLRLLVAFAISWLIALAFFATVVVSH